MTNFLFPQGVSLSEDLWRHCLNLAWETWKKVTCKRYARLQKIHQHFTLALKWKTIARSLHIGDVVFIHKELVTLLCWRLEQVIRLFPGLDGVLRLTDSKTTRSVSNCVRYPLLKIECWKTSLLMSEIMLKLAWWQLLAACAIIKTLHSTLRKAQLSFAVCVKNFCVY